jgi:hypothetical protein
MSVFTDTICTCPFRHNVMSVMDLFRLSYLGCEPLCSVCLVDQNARFTAVCFTWIHGFQNQVKERDKMSKNLTRKGLAFGAVVALGSSLFAGSPASAAELLTLAPSAGSSYNTLSTSTFTLNTGFTTLGANYQFLKYRVTNASLAELTVNLLADGSNDDEDTFWTGGSSLGDNEAVSSRSAFVVAPVAAGNNEGAIGVVNAITIATGAVAANTAITVQAWLDTDGDEVIDDGESTSPIRNIMFKNVAELTGTATLVSPFNGDDSISADVSLSGDINYQQIADGDVKVNFTGDDDTDATAALETVNAAWNALTGTYRATTGAALLVEAGELFRAQLYVDNNNSGAVTVIAADLEGAASNATAAAAGTAYSAEIKLSNAAGVKSTASNIQDNDADWTGKTDQNGTGVVKTDGRTATVSFFVGTDAATPVGLSDIPVRAVVSSANLALDDAVTVNGSSLYTGQSRTVNLTTGVGGLATLTIAGANADDAETVVITTSVAGTAAGTYTITFNDSVYGVTALNNEAVRSIKSAETYALEYKVVDQWGIIPANDTHRVWVADAENEGRTTAADFEHTAPVVDGVAKVSIVDNGVSTGSYKAVATLSKNGSAAAIGSTVTTAIRVVADTTPATVTLAKLGYGTAQAVDANNDGDYADAGDTDNTGKLIVETATLANFDARYAIPGATAPAVTAGNKVVISGTVANAAGTAIAGTPVTVAAKGFLFLGASRYFTDSIVVYTGTDGKFSVDAWSNLGGAQSVKVTAGSATAAQALTYAAATATAADFTVTSSLATVIPGRTADVVVAVKDKYGNGASGITVTLKSTGAGYLQSTSGTTDSNGEYSTKLISSAQDAGTATVTATVSIAGVATAKTATIKVEAPAVPVVVAPEVKTTIVGVTKAIRVRVENAKGEEVEVVVNGKTIAVAIAGTNSKLWVLAATKGTKSVKVYVDGDLAAVKTVTVK